MANNDELSAQLALMNKINAAMQTIATNAKNVKSAYESQFEFAQKTMQVMQQLANVNFESKFSSLNEQISATATQLDNIDGDPFAKLALEVTGAGKSIESMGSKIFKTGARLGVLGAIVNGLNKGFRNVVAMTKGVFGFFKGVADLAFSVAAAIIAIPFRILGGLMDMAVSTNGMSELRKEIEEVRKAFGDLKGPGASAIISTTKTLRGFSDTGLHAWRIFGNLAERLRHVREVAVEMGSTFSVFTTEFEQNGGAVLAYQKGLGIANEEMKGMAARSIVMGKTMSKVMNDVTKQTLGLGKAFGIDQKLIGREISKAVKDIQRFGTVSVKEIGVAAVYARKLGVELEKITGTLGAFETFDQAAENSAKLSQSFGVQIDAFKMMEAQNPADQIDMLRKQFKSAGVDSSAFNRQQLKLLATTTGLDEATAQQVFSAKNYGVSLDDIRKKADINEKKQLTQAEAMSKLADSIERLVKDGPALKSSFFDMFLEGIDRGIKRSPDFMRLMRNIRQSLRTVMRAGVELGRYFVENFAGVKDIIGGLADAFSPKIFGDLAGKINQSFKQLVEKKISFNQFAKDVFGTFAKFFSDESGPMKRVLDGFKSFFIKIADLAGPAIAWVGERIGDSLGLLADLISGNKKLPGVNTSGPKKFIDRLFEPIAKGLVKAWPAIKQGFIKLMDVLSVEIPKFIEAHPGIKEAGKKMILGLAGMLFGPAVMNGLIAFAVNGLIKGIGKAIFSGTAKGLLSINPAIASTMTKIASTVGRSLTGGLAAPVLAATAVIFAPVAVHQVMEKYGKAFENEFGVLDGKIATGATGLLHTLTLGLLPSNLEAQFGKIIGTMTGWYSTFFETIFGKTIVNDFKSALGTVVDFLDFFGVALQAAWEDTASFFKEAWPDIKTFAIDTFNALGSALKSVFKPLADSFETTYTMIKSGLNFLTDNPVVKSITKAFGGLGESLSKATGGFSLTDIGSKFGDDLAKRMLGNYEENLTTGIKESTKKAAQIVQKPTVAQPKASDNKTNPMDLSQVNSLAEMPEIQFSDKLENLTKQMAKSQRALTQIKSLAPAIKKAVGDGGVKSALDSINEIVAMVQKLDSALSVTPTVDVSTKLEKLATASGLGSRAQYTVKSKEVVINLNLSVTMDVDKVEKVMIMRKESIIRDRLNFATVSNPGSQGSQSIPESYTERVPQITRR